MNSKKDNNCKRKHAGQEDNAAKRVCFDKQGMENPKDISIETKRNYMKLKGSKKPQGGVRNNGVVTSGEACSPSLDTYAPRGINVMQYAEARALEIKNLKNALLDAKSAQNSRAFQQLPRHMRRRAASHDVRRVPRRLREKALQQMDPPKKKKQTRKQKRKPHNLLAEYSRRSKKHCWLETHIWHAKRFKMIEQWGYKLANEPCDKSFRATYRASAKSCLLQDKSYIEFLEFYGKQEEIISNLSNMMTVESAAVFTSSECLAGKCYADVILFTIDSYPRGAIGKVTLIWCPDVNDSSKLILMAHPTISKQVIEQLKNMFTLVEVDVDEEKRDIESTVDEVVTDQKNVSMNNDCKYPTLTYHKLEFVVLSLTGPLSLDLMSNVFCFPKNLDDTESQLINDYWFKLTNETVEQENNAVYNIYLDDPRFHIPPKKQNPLVAAKTEKQQNTVLNYPSKSSNLWDKDCRDMIRKLKKSDHEINAMRNKMLLPGCELNAESIAIAAVILRRPSLCLTMKEKGKERLYKGGYEIILPSGWAMPFLIAFVYQGARVGGLREDQNMSIEALMPHFPINYPDTSAGKAEAEKIFNKQTKKHKSYPPQNKVNYDVLGIDNPFKFLWQDLVDQWFYNVNDLLPHHLSNKVKQTDNKNFYVLRDKDLLCKINNLIQEKNETDCSNLMAEMFNHCRGLVAIRVYSDHRGCPEDNALLCVPKASDFSELDKRTSDPLSDTYFGPMEPKHKGLRAKFPHICVEHGILRHNARYIGVNTRWIIGFVQSGRYSFARGKGSGLGFVSVVGLMYLIHMNNIFTMLFRNIDTFQYRFCRFEVLI